jgi:hypothetical protein
MIISVTTTLPTPPYTPPPGVPSPGRDVPVVRGAGAAGHGRVGLEPHVRARGLLPPGKAGREDLSMHTALRAWRHPHKRAWLATQVRAVGTPAATLWLVSNGIFRGLGDTVTPLKWSVPPAEGVDHRTPAVGGPALHPVPSLCSVLVVVSPAQSREFLLGT